MTTKFVFFFQDSSPFADFIRHLRSSGDSLANGDDCPGKLAKFAISE